MPCQGAEAFPPRQALYATTQGESSMDFRKITLFAAIVAGALTASGCATVTEGRTQPVSVTATCDSQPVAGAACKLANDKGTWYANTPGSVVIHKSYQDLIVTCKDEHASGDATFKSSSNGGVWGNILAGGIIGYAVDRSNGAGFDYPTSLAVTLQGRCPGGAKQSTVAASTRSSRPSTHQ